MTRALFPPQCAANVRDRAKQCKLSKRQGRERELSPASSCVQKKFPSENSVAILGDQPPPLLPPATLFYGVAEPSALQSYLICISLLYTFFLLISAPSLCSEARQKEEKHSTRADISLYVHLTYKNFNSENNSCRLLNTASDG